jgi:pilus assembly protein CpaB
VKQRLVIVLMFALVIAGAASALLYRLISSQLSANRTATTQVVVAGRNLASGELIKDGDVKMADFAGTPPVGTLVSVDKAINRGVVDPIYQGEAVVDSRLAAPGAGAGLAATIPQGMRAVAVRVNDIVGVAGFVTPGSHVDILIAGNPPGGSGSAGTVTKTLLQNMTVLSAGQNIQKDAEGKPVSVPVVNVLVTPEQAEILSLASNDARIQLVLRNPTDKEESKTHGTALAYLFSGLKPPSDAAKSDAVKAGAAAAPRQVRKPAPPPPPPPKPEPEKVAPPPITVEVIHGSRRVETKFAGEESDQNKPSEGNAK